MSVDIWGWEGFCENPECAGNGVPVTGLGSADSVSMVCGECDTVVLNALPIAPDTSSELDGLREFLETLAEDADDPDPRQVDADLQSQIDALTARITDLENRPG